VSDLKAVCQYYKEPARNSETLMCQYGTLTYNSPLRVGRTVTSHNALQIELHAIIELHTMSNTRRGHRVRYCSRHLKTSQPA
jgi:hypothetical protein